MSTIENSSVSRSNGRAPVALRSPRIMATKARMNIADSTMLRTILCHSEAASGVHSISSAGPDSSRARKPSIDCTLKAGITPPTNGSMQFWYQPILICEPEHRQRQQPAPTIALAPPATTRQRPRSRT